MSSISKMTYPQVVDYRINVSLTEGMINVVIVVVSFQDLEDAEILPYTPHPIMSIHRAFYVCIIPPLAALPTKKKTFVPEDEVCDEPHDVCSSQD